MTTPTPTTKARTKPADTPAAGAASIPGAGVPGVPAADTALGSGTLGTGADTIVGSDTLAGAGLPARAPALPPNDPLRDPAFAAAPTLDPARPDPVPGREPPGELINAGLARPLPGAGNEIAAQAPGRDGLSGAAGGGDPGRGTIVETDRTIPAARVEYERVASGAGAARTEQSVFAERAILVSCHINRRRAGLAFGPNAVRLVLRDLTAAQVRALEADPLLTIRTA